ncbi:MAG: hypothetical protein OXC28_02540 [Defluviicoccus sp.]|nr:hypothetical protein [Defluviicoccus sp.]
MPVHRGNIGGVIFEAWRHALDHDERSDTQPDKRIRNRKRSSAWVDSLAGRFYARYEGDRYRLFWLGNNKNRGQFGRNEMLFDVAVCSVSTTRSRQRNAQDLEFIAQCHWQIESEFSRTNTREIVIDMSKLVMGSAENKLFIAAHRTSGEGGILEQCSEIAERCAGRVHFCFVSHPDDWKTGRQRPPALHEWVAGGWSGIALPAAV